MATIKADPGVRLRLRVPRDADGLFEYLRGLDPRTRSVTVYQLAYLGFLFKNNMMLKETMSLMPIPSPHPQPSAIPADVGKSSSPDQAQAGDRSLDSDLKRFGDMFGDTYKLAAR